MKNGDAAEMASRDQWAFARGAHDAGVGARCSIGLITLSVDRAFVDDFTSFLGATPDIGVFSTRIPMGPVATPESLAELKSHLSDAAALLVPGSPVDVIGFGCTSGTVAVGLETVRKSILAARPDAKVSTPIDAGVKALHRLGAKKISLLVPYHIPAATLVADYFADAGFDIDRRMTFDLDGDVLMNTLSRQALIEAAKSVMSSGSDALFISCTGLRTASVVSELEQIIGKPVVTSNQALAWDCLRLGGIADKIENRGRLLSL
jgi:maleate isomerase